MAWKEEEIECMIPRAGEFVCSCKFTASNGDTLENSYFEYEGEFFCCQHEVDCDGEHWSYCQVDRVPEELC